MSFRTIGGGMLDAAETTPRWRRVARLFDRSPPRSSGARYEGWHEDEQRWIGVERDQLMLEDKAG